MRFHEFKIVLKIQMAKKKKKWQIPAKWTSHLILVPNFQLNFDNLVSVLEELSYVL